MPTGDRGRAEAVRLLFEKRLKMVTHDDPPHPLRQLAARAVEADPAGLDDIAQLLKELTFEGARDDLGAFEAAWLPVLPTLIDRAARTKEAELARALHHVADHLVAIDPHPDVRRLIDHAWASHL